MSGLHVLGCRAAVLGATWAKAASVEDVIASKDSLRRGDEGEAVSYIQRFLGIEEDGKFGEDTEDAVIALQAAHVTEPHQRGVVNAVTYRAIMAYGRGKVPSKPLAPSPGSSGSGVEGTPLHDASESSVSTPLWKKALFAALVAGAAVGGALALRRKTR